MTRNFEDLQKQGQLFTDATEKATEKAIGKAYREAYDNALNQLKDLYARLGSKLDLPEARKYKRLENLLANLEKEYKALTGEAIKASGTASAQAYQQAFYGYTWSMEQAVVDSQSMDVAKVMKMDLAWGVIPTGAVEASVMSEYSGLTYIKTFNKNAVIRISDIQATITRSIAQGQGYAKVASSLKDLFNRGYSDALRVAITEMGRCYTEGQLLAHDKAISAGIDVEKMWTASLDSRTRPTHASADGKKADENGYFHVGGSIGKGPGLMSELSENIRCRCRIVDVLNGFPPNLRRIDGDIQKYQTFAEWAEPMGWDSKKGWPKK